MNDSRLDILFAKMAIDHRLLLLAGVCGCQRHVLQSQSSMFLTGIVFVQTVPVGKCYCFLEVVRNVVKTLEIREICAEEMV